MVTTRRLLFLILLVGLLVRNWQLSNQAIALQDRLSFYEGSNFHVHRKAGDRVELRRALDTNDLQVIEVRSFSKSPFYLTIKGNKEGSFGGSRASLNATRNQYEATITISLSHSRAEKSLKIDSMGSSVRRVPTNFNLRSSVKLIAPTDGSLDLFSLDGEVFSAELSQTE